MLAKVRACGARLWRNCMIFKVILAMTLFSLNYGEYQSTVRGRFGGSTAGKRIIREG